MARELGFSRSKMSRLKTGGSARLSVEEAVKAARLFGVSVEELLPGGGE